MAPTALQKFEQNMLKWNEKLKVKYSGMNCDQNENLKVKYGGMNCDQNENLKVKYSGMNSVHYYVF